MFLIKSWRRSLLVMLAFFISMNVHGVTIGQPAPEFTLKDMQGKNFNLTEQRGNIILINFWASWCGPCRKEMPVLQELQDKYQDLGVQVWGINVEQENQAGKDFLANLDLSFSIFFDETNKLSETYSLLVSLANGGTTSAGRASNTDPEGSQGSKEKAPSAAQGEAQSGVQGEGI